MCDDIWVAIRLPLLNPPPSPPSLLLFFFSSPPRVITKLCSHQVSWIWEPVDGQRDNIAVYHPVYGQSFPNLSFKDRVVFLHNSLENPSIRISNLRMSDAGRYTCEYATYPSGNEQGTTTLVMLAKPKNSANVVTVQAGTKSTVVARCEAADGKPAATIKWLASAGGNHSTSTTNGPDGTVTVRSEYRLVPTPADNGREVTCMVEQRIQERPWVYPVKLSVEYPPSVSIEGYDNNWYVGRSDAELLCLVNANPAPTTITWTARTVNTSSKTATNSFFSSSTHVSIPPSNPSIPSAEALEDPSSAGVVAGAVIGSLLALLLVVALVAVLLTRSRRQQRRGYPSSGDSIATGSGGSNGGDYGNKARLLFGSSGNNGSSKNGTGANNNGKFELDDSMEEEEEGHGGEEEMDVYLDDDMESQRDGSVISRTAIYV
uniref:Nectin cell adhesion molecule 3 n=1 Tax=Stegastes partitus TaxID=144197 RepID=A0A3B4ZW26_9TELE